MTKEEALIRKIRKNELAQERCKDLEEYFGVSKSILEDRKEFKKWLERGEQNVKKVDELESKLEQQPSEDCVSRKRIKQIVSNITAEYDAETIHIDRLMDEIDDMPPVTPTFPSSEDCVSRAEMLKYQQYLHGKMSNEENHKLWEFIKGLPPVTITHGTCKDCKHWKDSDGVYRRGIDAESKCPINNSRVFDGTFYCADYEKRGNEND